MFSYQPVDEHQNLIFIFHSLFPGNIFLVMMMKVVVMVMMVVVMKMMMMMIRNVFLCVQRGIELLRLPAAVLLHNLSNSLHPQERSMHLNQLQTQPTTGPTTGLSFQNVASPPKKNNKKKTKINITSYRSLFLQHP